MLIDIDKIIVGDRIRKDFGDIEELADNIRRNGLLNPLTVNGDFKLLAGERRYRACKLLGWQQVDVRMVNSEDEAQDLEIEMSENNVRRNFTGSELAEGIRRQMAIEQAKARERMSEGGRDGNVSTPSGTARDKAGEAFGISGRQAEKVLYVADHQDLLDPADFADWDEGRLSTNRAYQSVKAAQRQAEQERDAAKAEAAAARQAGETLMAEVGQLRRQVAEMPAPEVIEREVVREVVPQDVQQQLQELQRLNALHESDYQRLRKRNEETERELRKARDILGMSQSVQDVRRDVRYLIDATNGYVRQYGGLTWTVQQLKEVDKPTLDELYKASVNLATFASALVSSMEGFNGTN